MLQINSISIIQTLVQSIVKNNNPACILCYGSYGAGLQDNQSDIDLLVIAQEVPNENIRNITYSLPEFEISELSKDLKHWETSWIPLEDTLKAGQYKIEVGYNTEAWVETVVHKLMMNGEINFKEFPFRPYSFLGLIETCYCLYENQNYFTQLKTKIRPFPIQLKRAIVAAQYPVLVDSFNDLQDCANRNLGILAYQHFVFMAMDALIELIWVINDTYSPASKRTETFLLKLPELPPNFMDFINNVLPKCYENKEIFIQQLAVIKKYIEEKISIQKVTKTVT